MVKIRLLILLIIINLEMIKFSSHFLHSANYLAFWELLAKVEKFGYHPIIFIHK